VTSADGVASVNLLARAMDLKGAITDQRDDQNVGPHQQRVGYFARRHVTMSGRSPNCRG